MKKKLAISVSVVLMLVLVAVLLVACTLDADKVQKKLEDNGYEVNVMEYNEAQTEASGMTKVIYAYKFDEENEEIVQVTWFSDTDKLNEYYNELKEELANESEDGVEYKIVKKGNAVVAGTAAAVKLVG